MEFGFSLSPSSAIELDRTDNSLYEKLCSIEPGARTCIGCGSCSATCTARDWSGMRGRKQELEQMLSNCMLCGKCTMVCPRGINTRRVILTVCRLYDNVEGEL